MMLPDIGQQAPVNSKTASGYSRIGCGICQKKDPESEQKLVKQSFQGSHSSSAKLRKKNFHHLSLNCEILP